MLNPNFILLYVNSANASADFYTELLGQGPVELSPTFAMFALPSGVMLGLWGIDGVQPAPAPTGGFELAFALDARPTLDQTLATWRSRGLPIAQEPTDMDFGYTAVALDPDGHRLRLFVPH